MYVRKTYKKLLNKVTKELCKKGVLGEKMQATDITASIEERTGELMTFSGVYEAKRNDGVSE